MPSITDDEFQEFKFQVLADSVDEDWQGLWEPLWWAKTRFPQVSQAEREELAGRVMSELLSDGLIYFVSMGPWPPGRQNPTPLADEEAQNAIASATWRSVPLQDASIWFGGTAAGQHAVRERHSGPQG